MRSLTPPTTSRRGWAKTLMGAASLASVAALSVSLLAAAPAAAATTANLVRNSTFEKDTLGWNTNADAVAYRVNGGYDSSYSARVVRLNSPGIAVLNDYTNTVASTVAGQTYTFTAMVRTPTPKVSVNARIMEFDGRTLLGQANKSVWLQDKAWQQLSFTYTATKNGSNLDVNIMGWNMAPNTSFHVDKVSVVGSTTTTLAPVPAPSPSPSTAASTSTGVTAAGWKLAWADEFNGTTLDRTKWNAENLSTYGDGNKELACLMDRPQNLFLSGGALTLRARKENSPIKCGNNDARFPAGRTYTSAHLQTRGKAAFTHGRFEVRAKLPTQADTSKGLWPAFWMRPTTTGIGELDVLEAVGGSTGGNEHNKVHQTLWYDYSGTYKRQTFTHTFDNGSPSDGFHTYAAEWEPGVIRWYVDGKLTYQLDRSSTAWIDSAFAPDKAFYLRLNLAVGGSWPGSPDGQTRFAADYVVDYVRVYQR